MLKYIKKYLIKMFRFWIPETSTLPPSSTIHFEYFAFGKLGLARICCKYKIRKIKSFINYFSKLKLVWKFITICSESELYTELRWTFFQHTFFSTHVYAASWIVWTYNHEEGLLKASTGILHTVVPGSAWLNGERQKFGTKFPFWEDLHRGWT